MTDKPTYEELEQRVRELEETESGRKHAEEALLFERAQLLRIFDSIDEGIYVTDTDTYEILYVNRILRDVFQKELIGGVCYREFQGFNSPCEFCTNDIILKQKGSSHRWKYHNPTVDRDFAIVDRIIKWPDGRDVRFELAIDITDRMRAEESMRKSEEQYRTLLNNLPVGVYRNTPGPEGRFLMANPAFCKMFAFNNEEEVKKIPPADLYLNREERKQFSDALIKKGTLRNFKKTFVKKDGTSFHASITSSAVYGKDGVISHFDSIMVDITNQEALEDRLQQAQKMEAIGALAGGIAHDFNNVLYAMIGFTELAVEDTPEGSLIRKNLNQVLQGAMRAKDMVQQILTFSRQSEAKKKPIKIQRVVKEALKLLRVSIPSTIEIRQDIDPACGPVLADQIQIHQVVMNLAINAYHAMREEGGALELRLTQEKIGPDDSDADLSPGTYLKLTVKDTGHGMDSALMKKIFEPYFTTKGVGEGTGMGLAMVHGIAKDHGGDIRVNSRMGEGTSFHFYLPVIETTPVEVKNLASVPARRGNDRRSVGR